MAGVRGYRDAAWVLASCGTWAFTLALALYAYYEDGPAGVGLAVAVRVLPAAFVTPLVGGMVRRASPRAVLVGSLVLRCVFLVSIALAVRVDVPFAGVLALVAAFRVAGVPDRLAAVEPGPERRRLDELGFLAGAVAAGIALASTSLHTLFALSALPLLVAAIVALLAPAAPLDRVPERSGTTAGPAALLLGGRSAARAVVELLLVVAAVDLLAMGDDGFGWLSAALALGLLAGARLAPGGAAARGPAAGCALAGVPLALLALTPAPGVALALLVVIGVGFALMLDQAEHAPAAGGHLVDALARTLGATVAAALVYALGDTAALAVAGGLIVALGVAAAVLLERSPRLGVRTAG